MRSITLNYQISQLELEILALISFFSKILGVIYKYLIEHSKYNVINTKIDNIILFSNWIWL